MNTCYLLISHITIGACSMPLGHDFIAAFEGTVLLKYSLGEQTHYTHFNSKIGCVAALHIWQLSIVFEDRGTFRQGRQKHQHAYR